MAHGICTELLALEPQIKNSKIQLAQLCAQRQDRLNKLCDLMQQQQMETFTFEGHEFVLKRINRKKAPTASEKVEQLQEKLRQLGTVDPRIAQSLLQFDSEVIETRRVKIK